MIKFLCDFWLVLCGEDGIIPALLLWSGLLAIVLVVSLLTGAV